MIGMLLVQQEQLKEHVFNGDKALDEYMQMKGDKEEFVEFLKKKFKDDQDNEKAEEKQI